MRTFTEAIRSTTAKVLTILLVGLIAALLGGLLLLAILPTIAHAEGCPNEVFRTGPSAHLPECRAYELVTPVEKNGGFINLGSFSAAPGGEAVGFTSVSGFADATSALNTSTGYQASRSSTGWGTTAETESEAQFIDHHGTLGKDFLDESFGNCETFADASLTGCGFEGAASSLDPGLEEGVRLWRLQGVAQPESGLAFYRRGRDGVNVDVGPAAPPTAAGLAQSREGRPGFASEEFQALGWSADGSHIVFDDPESEGPNQWSFSAPSALLEYAGMGNTTPLLVGVDNSGHFVNGCSGQLLGGTTSFSYLSNPISTDGNRIFFTDECKGELFARVNNGQPQSPVDAVGTCTNSADACTVPISDPSTGPEGECEQCTDDPEAPVPAEFLGASENGTKAFFYTSQPLLEGSGGLYEYDFNAPEGEKVTRIAPGSLLPLSELRREVLVSEDGSHVYFVSQAVLSEQPSPDVQGLDRTGNPVTAGAVAQAGADNLYVADGGHIAFVAELSAKDLAGEESEYDLTPNGRFLVLDVHKEFTSDDTTSVAQVFEYDAATGSMARVSIGDDGYNDNGNGMDALIATKGEHEGSYSPSAYFSHLSVSADGAYVFFQSGDGLTPQALNRVFVGTGHLKGPAEPLYAENIYEYHAGHVYLISDGQDISTHGARSQVELLSTDLSGRDVFFETTDQLVGQDTDTNKDIYDARVDGGFPAPVAPPGCEGDACQGSLNGAPVLLSPGSEFQAGGNPPLAGAAPGVVKAKPKALTNARRLGAALKACKREPRKQQAKCAAQARKRYAPANKKRAK